MANVVCIHGIAQELKSRVSLLAKWEPELRGGISNLDQALSLDAINVDMAFYGRLFRPDPDAKSDGIPNYKAGDLRDSLELELLKELYGGLPTVSTADKKGGVVVRTTAHMVQALAMTPFFGKKAQKVVIWYLKQVRRYLAEPSIRNTVQQSLVQCIRPDTKVIVAHSLGTIAAYEALHEHPDWPVDTFISLGSPLGIPALLSRLLPPVQPGRSHWPRCIKRWVNIADSADVVALRKDLRPLYDPRVDDHLVHNGATMHYIEPYLTAPQTGRAIARGLGLIA